MIANLKKTNIVFLLFVLIYRDYST